LNIDDIDRIDHLDHMEKRNFYDIHDIVGIDSQIPIYELEYFRTEKLPRQASLIVNVKNDIGKNTGLFHIHRRIIEDDYLTKNRISYTEHLGPLGSQFSIDFSSPFVVTVNGLIARSPHVLYVNLVEPLLRFLIISRGHVLLHSACIATNNQNSVLLSAPPDTGKTTTVIKCIRKGLGFLSDDMTIITPHQELLCFPKPMTISAHTFHTAIQSSYNTTAIDNTLSSSSSTSSYPRSNSFSTVILSSEGQSETSFDRLKAADSQNNNNHHRGGLRIRSIVHSKGGRQFMRKLGKRNVPIFTINTLGQTIIRPPKFRIEDVIRHRVKIVPKTSVGSFFFLERGSGEEIVSIAKDEALTKAIENSDDAFLFPPYKDILRYLTINGASASDLLLQEKKIITKLLEKIDTKVIRSGSRSWHRAILDHSLIKVGLVSFGTWIIGLSLEVWESLTFI
jgi:dolichol-phosphate mannosyltransferase